VDCLKKYEVTIKSVVWAESKADALKHEELFAPCSFVYLKAEEMEK
tara:strand:+ start:770 stop:907 length:138 start_codon:yes stop_codon:yes gene_type:complete